MTTQPEISLLPVNRKLSDTGGRRLKDRLARRSFLLLTALPLLILLLLLAALAIRAWPIFEVQSIGQLLGGTDWHPLRGSFGFLPFISGTLWVTLTSLILAVPPCLMTAIYLAEYCSSSISTLVKPLLDLLAGIPSVVYGVWGMVAIVPLVQKISPVVADRLGFLSFFQATNPTGFSVLAGGIVLAVMIAPFIIAVTYEVLQAVPEGSRLASLAVGATRWQTLKNAVLPQCAAGILAGIVLGASRALGETMAVLMVVGNVPKLPTSIFDPAYPLPALIANNYGEMMSIPLYDSALMAAALLLLVIVLFFNVLSTLILRSILRRVRK
jgi:phosphate transport system permease protein